VRHWVLGAVVVIGLLGRDLHRLPEKTFVPFATLSLDLPADLVRAMGRAWTVAAVVAGAAWVAAAVIERGKTRAPRVAAAAILAGGATAALVVRAFVFPPLLAHLAPRAALAAYARFGTGEPLGVLGVSARAAAYDRIGRGATPIEFRDPKSAYAWLAGAGGNSRRWLLLRAADLPAVNALYRAAAPLHDLPVVEGRAGVLLAASSVPAGAAAATPLARILPSAAPTPQHPVDARLGQQIDALGWSLVDDEDRPLAAFPAHGHAHVKVLYRVLAATHGFCTFLHVDHHPTRFTAENKDWTAYPMPLWQSGDVVVDDYEVSLPTHFGRGEYPIWFGFGQLPCSDDRRLEVTRGSHDANRVHGGRLRVE
jgi:hypothetical protein